MAFTLLSLFMAPSFMVAGEVQVEEWTGVTTDLMSVFMIDANDGWAVGGDGIIIHWDGGMWTEVVTPTTDMLLLSVFMVSSSEGWAVGQGLGISGTIIHWDETNWNIETIPLVPTLFSVYMVNENDGWAVGDSGSILNWDGTSWNIHTASNVGQHLFSVHMINANDGWAVGSTGTIIHWDGTNWNNVSTPITTQLNSVFMVSADDGWAVGQDGKILHWDGTSWNIVPSPTTEYLTSVFMIDANDGWAVGGRVGWIVSTILHWDGTRWNEVQSPANMVLNSVSMTGPDDGWAVGSSGTIVRFQKDVVPFELSGLSIEPSEVKEGETVTISVDCRNVDISPISQSVVLKINNAVENEKTVTLDSDESVTVSFEVSATEEGTHSVDVDGLSGSFEVRKPSFPQAAVVTAAAAIAGISGAAYVMTQRARTTARPQACTRSFLNKELNTAQSREVERIIKMIKDDKPMQEIIERWKGFVEDELAPFAMQASSDEILSDINQLFQFNLQREEQRQTQMTQAFATLQKEFHDTMMAIIENMKKS